MNATLRTALKAPTKSSLTPVPGSLLQRKCACGAAPNVAGECEACSNKQLALRRSAANQAEPSAVPPIVHEVLRSPGQPLDTATRRFMEPRFGHDFGHVRVHTDRKAAESAQAVNAMAYTVGSNIVFGPEPFRPEAAAGRKLLAHELAHTIQQSEGGAVIGTLPDKLPISHPNDSLEREADVAAAHALAGNAMGPGKSSPSGSAIQRLAGSLMIQRATDEMDPGGEGGVGGGSVEEPAGATEEPVTDDEGEATEMTGGRCAGGSRRLDYSCLRNLDRTSFTVGPGCTHVRVNVTAQWQGEGCEFGPPTYPIALDGQSRNMRAGNRGIEGECTGTPPQTSDQRFTVRPGAHTLTISTGGAGGAGLCLQIRGFMQIS